MICHVWLEFELCHTAFLYSWCIPKFPSYTAVLEFVSICYQFWICNDVPILNLQWCNVYICWKLLRMPIKVINCRNRERQQRFRQRQKAKIESLETQVSKLTTHNKSISAEKSDLSTRVLGLSEALQEKERMVTMMTNQMAGMQCNPLGTGIQSDLPQLTMSYTSPPLALNNAQVRLPMTPDLYKNST